MYCLCVNVYCHRVTTQLQLINMSHVIFTFGFLSTYFHKAPTSNLTGICQLRAVLIQTDGYNKTASRFCRPCDLFCKHFLNTWPSWIRVSWYKCGNNQQDALYRLIYYSMSALHVSGDVFAHYQKHLTVFTVSGGVHPRCCWLVSLRDTSQQHCQIL